MKRKLQEVPMLKKGVLWVVVGLIIIVGLGPIFVAKVADRMFKMPKRISSGALLIKASGKVSIEQGQLILTTPKGINNYILTGAMSSELKKFVGKDTPVYVFGRLMNTDLHQVQDKIIRASIDITEFNTKDFTIGKSMSPEVAAAICQKVQEKAEFRQSVLKKLGQKDLDVISGKLNIVPGFTVRDGKSAICLVVSDKYGDAYNLLNDGAIKYKRDDYKGFAGQGMDVVVTGQVTLPNPNEPAAPGANTIPFAAKGIYNREGLTELVVQK
ncbi:MAG TPA: hypothetical protein VHO90_12065 [Bacteroidales bacterium]|nr:hypothetical protein [Bacteroidales bacterium]